VLSVVPGGAIVKVGAERITGIDVLAARETATVEAHAMWAPDVSDELLRLAVQVGGIGIYDTDLERQRTRFTGAVCYPWPTRRHGDDVCASVATI
jgi:hypothetical protein